MALRVASSRLLLELPSTRCLGSQGLRLFSMHHECTADISSSNSTSTNTTATATRKTSSSSSSSSGDSSRDSSSYSSRDNSGGYSSSTKNSSSRGSRSTSRKGPVRFVPLDNPEGAGDNAFPMPLGWSDNPKGRPREASPPSRKYPSRDPANERQWRGLPQPAHGKQQDHREHGNTDLGLTQDSPGLGLARGARIGTGQGRGSPRRSPVPSDSTDVARRAPGPSASTDMANHVRGPSSFRHGIGSDQNSFASPSEQALRASLRPGPEAVSERALRASEGGMLSKKAGRSRGSFSVPSVDAEIASRMAGDDVDLGARTETSSEKTLSASEGHMLSKRAGRSRGSFSVPSVDVDEASGTPDDEVVQLLSGEPTDRKQWQEGVLRALEAGAKMPWEMSPELSTEDECNAARLTEEHCGGATWQRVASPLDGDQPELARATNPVEFREGKAYALRVLGSRLLPEASLRQKLKARGVSERTASELLAWLKERGLQNDAIYAEAFANSRLRTRLWSPARIAFELRKKGVPRDVIDRVIEETCSGPTSLRPSASPEASAWLDFESMESAEESISHAALSSRSSVFTDDDCDSHSHCHRDVTGCDAPGSLPADVWRKLLSQCRRLWAQYNRKDPSKAYNWLLGWLLRRQYNSEVIGAVMKDVQGSR